MCAYDTTVVDTVDPKSSEGSLPICLRRDNLTSKYFPQTSRSLFAVCVVLCLVFLMTSFYRLHHTDLWSHLNFGRWIVTNGQLPDGDPFSIRGLSQGSTGTAWLSQVLGYWTVETFGYDALSLGHALLVTLGCGLTILAIRQRTVTLPWATAGAVATYLLAMPIVGAIRPQMFAMVGVPLALLAISYLTTKRHHLIWLPITFAIWANLHGSFAIGLVIIGAGCLHASWRLRVEAGGWRAAMKDTRFARVWLALVLSVAGTCINPHGYRLLLDVASFGGNAALANITEWQPLTIRSLSGLLFYSSLLITALLLRFSTRRIEVHEVLLTMLFAAATLTSMRMLIWWALIWPWIVAPHAAVVWRRLRPIHQNTEALDTPRDASMRSLVAMGFVFTTLLIAPPTHAIVTGQARGVSQVLSSQTPIFVAEELNRRQIEGRVFSTMAWADYLLWVNQGRIQPLVYSHVHLMRPDVWSHYAELDAGSARWLEIVDNYRLNYLVLSADRHEQLARRVIANVRSDSPRTRVIYRDEKSMVVKVLHPPKAEKQAATWP